VLVDVHVSVGLAVNVNVRESDPVVVGVSVVLKV